MKRVLTIAGSDSGGGAGIQADLKTITVLGAYGASALTALTAQNTLGVQGIHETPADFVREQIVSVLSDIGADSVKTGMLAGSEIVRIVAETLREFQTPFLVVDPVMVATSGDPLLSPDAVDLIKTTLLPIAEVVTPNLSEAAILADLPVHNLEAMKTAAKAIHALGSRHVLIKGGHLENQAVDLFYDGKVFTEFSSPRIITRNTHGTGCTLSAALATYLAQGYPPLEATRKAKAFVTSALRAGLNPGAGPGPTNPGFMIAKWKQREMVMEGLSSALQNLLQEPLGALIPEIRSNLGYGLPGASNMDDVAAIPGRITQIGDRLMAWQAPTFGASKHIAKVILTTMSHYPDMRSAMNIRFAPTILAACQRLNLELVQFDRADEPKMIKEREGSSLEWGTHQALLNTDAAPDGIYDRGDVGKEPVIRILGPTPGIVVDKVIRIHREMIAYTSVSS